MQNILVIIAKSLMLFTTQFCSSKLFPWNQCALYTYTYHYHIIITRGKAYCRVGKFISYLLLNNTEISYKNKNF